MKNQFTHLYRKAILTVLLISFFHLAHSTVAYLRSTAGAPWGQTTNEAAMNTVFGSGMWQDLRYETVNPATLFTGSTTLIYMEGSDAIATEFNTFLNANRTLIEAWVTAGGRLFINAAPNEGGNINLGFGSITLVYPVYSGPGNMAVSHAIFNGPYTPVGTSWSGSSFSHASISGSGYTVLINGTGGPVLVEKQFGVGVVMLGGMTTTNFHSPQPNATNLRLNILNYLNTVITCTPYITATSGVLNNCGTFNPVTLTASAGTSYLWSTGETTQSIVVTSPGSYSAFIDGTLACNSPLTATLNPVPVITPGGSLSICSGSSVVLTSSSPTGNFWSNGATTQSITVSTAGSYTVSVGGCISAPVLVTINALPGAFTPTSNSPVYCTGSTLNLFATSTNAVSYSWTGPNGFTSSLQNPTIANASSVNAGLYTVVATNAAGCTRAGTTNVVIYTNTLSGTFTVGPGGNYPTITAAVAAYNSSCLTGNVVFELINSSYITEILPITINANTSANAANTLTIRPAAGVTSTISGSSSFIFRLFGADYVTIDGSNNQTNSRDLSVINTSPSSNTGAVVISSTGLINAGATNNVIKNLNISCGVNSTSSTSFSYGIFCGGSSIGTQGISNDNNVISGNYIYKAVFGITVFGNPSTLNVNNIVSNNIVGPVSFGVDQIGRMGIHYVSQTGGSVTGNTIRFVGGLGTQAAAVSDIAGINLSGSTALPSSSSSSNTNIIVAGNLIHDIVNEDGNTSYGINIVSPTSLSNNTIANNVIHNVRSSGNISNQAAGIYIGTCNSDNVVFNSINMTGDLDPAGATTAAGSSAGIRIGTTSALNLKLVNNSVLVDLSSNTTSLKHFGIVAPAGFSWGTGFSNNNDIFVNASNPQMVFGGLGTGILPATQLTSLSSWQTAFTPNQDLNSISLDPLYVAFNDLHPGMASPLYLAGLPVAGVTTDFAGVTRNAVNPTIGAYESNVGPPVTYYADADGDGYGDLNVTIISTTGPPAGYVTGSTDCNDGNSAVHPGAAEICNGIDDNCNAMVDENTALHFDGVNDHVQMSSYVVPTTGDFTVEFWINSSSITGYKEFISQGSSGDAFYIGTTDGSDLIRCGDKWVSTGVSLPLNQWVHVALTKSGTNATLFLNGIQMATMTNYSISSAGTLTQLGTQYGGIPEYPNAMMDELRVWNVARTQSQIQNNMNIPLAAQPGLVACYNFEEGIPAGANTSLNQVLDHAGSNKHGTLVNFSKTGSTSNWVTGFNITPTWYQDLDNDNYGNPAVVSASCTQPAGYVANGGDCNDSNSLINPGATEFCNLVDDNCDGLIDGQLPTGARLYLPFNNNFNDASGLNHNGTGYNVTAATGHTGTVNAAFQYNGGTSRVEVPDHADLKPSNFTLSTWIYYTSIPGNLQHIVAKPLCGGYGDSYAMYFNGGMLNFGWSTNPGMIENYAFAPPAAGQWHHLAMTFDDGVNQARIYIDNVLMNTVSTTATIAYDNTPFIIGAEYENCGLTFYYGGKIDEVMLFNRALTAAEIALIYQFNSLNTTAYYLDNDNDGYGDPATVQLYECSGTPSGYIAVGGDCDDNNPAIHAPVQYYVDADNDGYGSVTTALVCSLTPPSGYATNNTDCNDANAAVNPAAIEICNGLDDDCDSYIDDSDPSVTGQSVWYADADVDGYGDPNVSLTACLQPSGYITNNTDCDDTDPLEHPGQVWFTDNDGDDYGTGASVTQCLRPVNGFVAAELIATTGDCDDNNSAIQLTLLYYVDYDQDGYGSATTAMLCSLTAPTGYATNNTDCNDNDATVHLPQQYFVDADHDGYGSTLTAMVCASTPPVGYSSVSTDCNDAVASINPGASEICNGADDDCDLFIDDADPSVSGQPSWYADTDLDGFGDPNNVVVACTQPAGYLSNNTDCDDTDANEHPGQIWYIDNDGDDYGTGATVTQCLRPSNGYLIPELVAITGDCNDNNAAIVQPIQYFVDADHDGYGSTNTAMVCATTAPLGYSTNSNDCNDANAAVNPGATEVCNGIDDDCDTFVDDADPSVTGQPVWYADTDLDGYGDPNNSQAACTQPSGFLGNNTDCDDTDANEHPGQVWYIDNDGDDYGTGATVTQCLRPSNGYLAPELASTTGDCNDNNAGINPVSQTLTFSEAANYSSALVYPVNGTSYTNFTFEVIYTDATNSLPPATYPRIILDYEGNGVFNNTNDRVVIMNPYDVNDLNTADGKRYIGSINSLTTGTNWQSRVQIVNGSCVTQFGPFNYPDVLVLPDLQIFANDITFSSANPSVGSPQTITAVIHNNSDFAAQNFYAHLVNQYDNSSPADILVSNLPPHSSQSVSWTITTPAVPAWCPMQVSVDYTNVIDESNELDNSAIRPFINGNFNLPGGIAVVNAAASPSVSYSTTGAYTIISGRALYYGTPVPLADSSVAGGSVSFTVAETNANFTATTNSQGYFNVAIPTPFAVGTYNISGSITDFTLTGNFSTSFTVIPPPACLPDLRTSINVSSNYIVAGNSISGSILVHNYGCQATAVNTVLDVSQTGGTPAISDATIPPLAAGATHTTTFTNLVFNTPGTYTICGTADATSLVVESNESNNTSCRIITVIPALPDIYPVSGPYHMQYICNTPSPVGFSVGNAGGAATGPFNCEVIVRLNNSIIGTYNQSITNIPAFGSTSFNIPFNYASAGNYSFELKCDIPLPGGNVVETNENNNAAIYSRSVANCLPDLSLSTCEQFDVQPVDPQFPGTVTYLSTLSNSGNATATGPINVRFQLSGGAVYNTQYMGNLAPGQSTVVSVNAPSVAPATQTLTATADPDNLIVEWNENNSVSGSLCHDFQPVPRSWPCGYNFWDQTYLANQTVYLSVGLRQHFMYDASSVKVRFQVSGPGLAGTITLGDAIVTDIEQTCSCPRNAVLPTSFAFPQVGTYTFTMTADPDGEYTECVENNNVLVVTVTVVGTPDMRILSQHINPSMLNPQPGQLITMDITYENLGISNIGNQMELKVLVDEVPLDSVYPVNGLVSGDNITISIPATWSSNAPGTHVIRAFIDSDNQIVESNESNNQATRAVIVGEAANLYFQVFAASNPTPSLHDPININARIGNNGDLACEADVQFFYITNSLDTIQIGTIHVNVDDNDSVNISLPWNVLDPATTLVGKIINASTLEFTYDDNTATTEIGAMVLSFNSTQSCNGGADGTLTPVIAGGEPPYSYLWSTSYNGSVMTNSAGTYMLTVSDNTGQQVTANGTITNDPGVTYYADADGDTYGNAAVTQISCDGPPAGYVANDDDCDDTNAAVNPGATEVCNGIDDDCDGLTDTNDPTLSDNILPTINCVANISVNNDANSCGAVVTYATPSFNDNCSGASVSQTAGLASGSVFPVGTTTNTFVVTDFVGNTSSCSFDVVVADNTYPTITCPADISMIATSANGAVVTYSAPVGTDNCSGSSTNLVAGFPSGATFPIGITTVTYQVTDAAGSTTSCSFTVHITGLPPQIVCPASISVPNTTGLCEAQVSFAATEIIGIPASSITYSHAPGSVFPLGTTTVTATAVNPVGTSVCTFDVTVLDTELPVINCPSNMNTIVNTTGCLAVVNYSLPAFSDNCSGATISQTAGLPSGASFPLGTTTNTFVVTDAAGNAATCSFNVTITNSKPIITSFTSSAGPIFPVNTSTTMTAEWGDEANGGPYTVTFIWNDGTANTVLTGVTGNTASASHTYVSSAVFEPSVRVTDACGSISNVVSGTSTYQYLAVYVIGSQFTTMGGWYNTPAGSYMAEPSFNGRVNMGNVVKPMSGAFKGELELNIKEFNFKVHAVNPTTWDYLTISGCCYAQFRGSCKVNGVSGYTVLVAQTDINYPCGTYGGNNMIRVKVWNTSTLQVIYDTQPGDPDNALPALPLNGGAIQVHTQNNCVARMEKPGYEVNCYPNPVSSILNVDVISDKDQLVKLQLFDVTGRIVHEQDWQTIAGVNNTQLDVSAILRGVYFVEVTSASGIRRVKVVLD